MKKYTHGGDIYGRGGRKVYDFSANINPLGLPESARQAIIGAVDSLIHYPDPYCRELIEAIANYEGVDKETIVCGNGVADLLFRLGSAFEQAMGEKPKALLTAPTFSEYEEAVIAGAGCVFFHRLSKQEDFALTQSILKSIDRAADGGANLLFLCNPNNPTGLTIASQLMEEIISKCRQLGIFLVIDECFMEMTDRAAQLSQVKQAGASEDILVLKAFTKTFAMPGLRLGYAISGNKKLIDQIFMTGQPWSVNSLAQAAGKAVLSDPDHVEKGRIYVEKERRRLMAALKEAGAKVYPSQANYIFFEMEDGEYFRQSMEIKGFLIRSCGNFVGLDDNFLRTAVRTKHENDAFIKALRDKR